MFKRVIKIILILLGAFLLVLGIVWLVGRHSANKAGSNPLSFKEFLGLGTKQSTVPPVPGDNTSNFGNTGTSNTGTNDNTNNGTGNTPQVSQFTNSGINPTNSSLNTSGNGLNIDSNSGLTIGSDTTGDTSSAPVCSDADTNITFTADELAQLNDLQNRFYALAQTLHTDADVATEVANHDAFSLKAEQATELYNYCESKLPLITDPKLQQHVATPFWHAWNSTTDPTNPNQWNTSGRTDRDTLMLLTFTGGNAQHLSDIHDNSDDSVDTTGIKGPYGLLNFSEPGVVPVVGSVTKGNTSTDIVINGVTQYKNPADYLLLEPVVERILRVNLW